MILRLRGFWIKGFLPFRTYRLVFRILFWFLGPLLGWGFLLLSGPEAQAGEIIRVLIVKDVSAVKISGDGLVLHDGKTGQMLFKNRRFSSLVVERGAGYRLRLPGHSFSPRELVAESSRGLLGIQGRQYRDKLKIIPGPNGDIWVINILPLEEYVAGLINFEISSQWPLEAVKAQVVAARTYAHYQRNNRSSEVYDVDSGVLDQVYGGAGREDLRSRRAVQETAGELILHQGNPIFAVYSSCCGGKTEWGENLWTGNFPYLRTVECSYCLDSPYFVWNYSLPGERLAAALEGTAGSKILAMDIEERSQSRRVLRIAVQTERSRWQGSGKDFRRLLGYDQLRSTNFVVSEKDGIFQFSGLGWGHGAGLCQWGARGMAEAGMDYRSILKHYYRDVEIGKGQ